MAVMADGSSVEAVSGVAGVRTLLIDNYDSYTYNLHQLIAEVNGVEPTVIRNDEMSWEALKPRLDAGEFHNIVISPGPGTPEREADIGLGLHVLQKATDIPILGVCLGHQALGMVHGASVVHAPEPVHGRLSRIAHSGSHPLFAHIPQDAEAVRYHSLALDPKTLPDCLEPIAWCRASEPCASIRRLKSLVAGTKRQRADVDVVGSSGEPGGHGSDDEDAAMGSSALVMAVAHKERPHLGVQYHPESIGSQYGIALLVNFRDITAKHLQLPRQPHVANIIGPPGCHAAEREQQVAAAAGISTGGSLRLRWVEEKGLLERIGGTDKIFWELFGLGDAKDTFWLDSATAPERGRFSYMGSRGGALWQRVVFRLPRSDGSSRARLTIEHSCGRVEERETEFFDHLEAELKRFRLPETEKDNAALPFDFLGGYVGYLSYEMKAECGGKLVHDAETPDAAFLLADQFVVADHHTSSVYVLALEQDGTVSAEDSKSAALEWVQKTSQALRDLAASGPRQHEASSAKDAADSSNGSKASIEANVPFRLRHPREHYMKNVASCQQALHDGESYEVCLTTALQRSASPCPVSIYKALRRLNPAPYGGWFSVGGSDAVTVCCSSPERFLRCNKCGTLEAKPIKGTAPRVHGDPDADAAAAAELETSEKDRAENLMITDLLRNDLGRVCEVGSVHVPSLMAIESFATVHQLVSTVRGQRRPESSIVDCLRATFPGGSMTGAPKIRTMDILDKLEDGPRGVYSGSLGYISFNNTFDLNIVIRTAVIKGNGSISIGAGGAIVVQSTPEGEYDEMRLKARALMAAVGQCDAGGSASAPPAAVDEHTRAD